MTMMSAGVGGMTAGVMVTVETDEIGVDMADDKVVFEAVITGDGAVKTMSDGKCEIRTDEDATECGGSGGKSESECERV